MRRQRAVDAGIPQDPQRWITRGLCPCRHDRAGAFELDDCGIVWPVAQDLEGTLSVRTRFALDGKFAVADLLRFHPTGGIRIARAAFVCFSRNGDGGRPPGKAS